MGNNASAIHSQLLVPFAGTRGYFDAGVYSLGSYAFLWSSSPSPAWDPRSFYLSLSVGGFLDMSYDLRAVAYSLRCVYDSYETYTPS